MSEVLLKMTESKARKKPKFKRSDIGKRKYKGRITTSWRYPHGMDNKVRLKIKGYSSQPNVGYRNPRDIRGKHPSGYEEVLVHSLDDLDMINPDFQAARIAKAVGLKKTLTIQDKADELGVIILNPRKALEEELEEFEEEKE